VEVRKREGNATARGSGGAERRGKKARRIDASLSMRQNADGTSARQYQPAEVISLLRQLLIEIPR